MVVGVEALVRRQGYFYTAFYIIAYTICHAPHMPVTINDWLIVRSNAQRRENTVIPKLITRENIPRRRKRIPLNIPNPMGKPRRIEPSSLFCPFVTINNIIPRTNACKKILSSNLFLHNNYETFYRCRITATQLNRCHKVCVAKFYDLLIILVYLLITYIKITTHSNCKCYVLLMQSAWETG